ncbi:unnamed protein product [Dovyalis caffra]|uniref:Uncharacterized protein n=1 Tax=Dovyalis caffra TaxID=77055 RepID=A0AAV1R7V4_9ROSI|nr:unnamed protein product [Dovyalis caffra]
MGSSRSYHVLMGGEEQSFNGSSHRRTRSDYQPPTMEFLEQRTNMEFHRYDSLRKRSVNPPSIAGGSNFDTYPRQMGKQLNN